MASSGKVVMMIFILVVPIKQRNIPAQLNLSEIIKYVYITVVCVKRTDGLKLGVLDGSNDGISVGAEDGLAEDMKGVRFGVRDTARDMGGKNEGVLD